MASENEIFVQFLFRSHNDDDDDANIKKEVEKKNRLPKKKNYANMHLNKPKQMQKLKLKHHKCGFVMPSVQCVFKMCTSHMH